MLTPDRWISLSARIRGLINASHLVAELFQNRSDSSAAMDDLGAHASAILSDLRLFGSSLDPASESARKAIQRVSEKIGALLIDRTVTSDTRQTNLRSSLVSLAALEGEVSYLLRDREEPIRSRTERAFQHLNRLIMVDKDVRRKWQQAYTGGETECEKLGAAHLLAHGIWAFKVNAAGGRTDLVYQEPLSDLAGIQRSADGLVLTEWKKHSKRTHRDSLFEAARLQAQKYAVGVLAGVELTRHRYAILVSEEGGGVPDDVDNAGVVYRHIDIVVKPKTPSVRGRRS